MRLCFSLNTSGRDSTEPAREIEPVKAGVFFCLKDTVDEAENGIMRQIKSPASAGNVQLPLF